MISTSVLIGVLADKLRIVDCGLWIFKAMALMVKSRRARSSVSVLPQTILSGWRLSE